MKLDKRVADLEAKEIGAVSRKFYLLQVGKGQTVDEAKDEYGRDRIGPNDVAMIVVGFSEVDGDNGVQDAHGRERGKCNETR